METTQDIEIPHPVDELAMLKDRARLMGITHSPNIGVETLRTKIKEKLEASEPKEADEGVNALTGDEPAKTKPKTVRQQLMEEQLKLVRLRISNLDPKKKDLPGEIMCVANEFIGTVKKFIPFDESSDEGYHVPYCLYTMMKERRFLNIQVTKKANGNEKITQRWSKEFALEVLPPLTQDELKQLASAQLAAGIFNDTNLETLG